MNNQKLSWKDIVLKVENANLELERQNRLKSKERQQKYSAQLDSQVLAKNSIHQIKKRVNLETKEKLKQQAQSDLKRQSTIRAAHFQRESQYRKCNLSLIEKRIHAHSKDNLSESSLVSSLIIRQSQRKDYSRQKLNAVNKINQILRQSQIKKHQDIRQQIKVQGSIYNSHVENYYEKRNLQRNSFKQKYLKIKQRKLFPTEGNQVVSSQGQEYLKFWQCQMNESRLKKQQKDILDKHSLSINKNISKPDSSPAYLGRNILQPDRKRQLQMLQNSLFINSLQNSREKLLQFRTQPYQKHRREMDIKPSIFSTNTSVAADNFPSFQRLNNLSVNLHK